eukprot:402373_1
MDAFIAMNIIGAVNERIRNTRSQWDYHHRSSQTKIHQQQQNKPLDGDDEKYINKQTDERIQKISNKQFSEKTETKADYYTNQLIEELQKRHKKNDKIIERLITYFNTEGYINYSLIENDIRDNNASEILRFCKNTLQQPRVAELLVQIVNNIFIELSNKIVYQGYLWKQSKYIKKYHERWCVLQNCKLLSFRQKEDPTPTVTFDLTLWNQTETSNINQFDYDFQLSFSNFERTKHQKFRVESRSQMQQWIKYIELYQHPNNKPYYSLNPPILEGYVSMVDSLTTYSNDRWIRLFQNELLVFIDHRSSTEDIVYHLSVYDEIEKTVELCVIKIISTSQNLTTVFQCNHQNEMEHWFRCIKNVVYELGDKMTWTKLISAIKHELHDELAAAVKHIVDNSEEIEYYDVSQHTVKIMLNKLGAKNKVNMEEIVYLKKLMQKAIIFQPIKKETLLEHKTDNALLQYSLLQDIFDVHRAFLFTQYHFRDYNLNQFLQTIPETKEHIDELQQISPTFNFNPSYIINDDLFEIARYLFATTIHLTSINGPYAYHIFIICKNIEAIYDVTVRIKCNIDVGQYLTTNGFLYKMIVLNSHDISDEKQIALICEKYCISDHSVIIVDRRNSKNVLIVAWGGNIETLQQLRTNYCIGMKFVRSKDDINKAYLLYGINERMRFYPEHLTSIIPRLFKKTFVSNYDYLQQIYSSSYRHGFHLNLQDNVFNDYYKMITGFEHHAVCYYRCSEYHQEHKHDNDSDECDEYNLSNVQDCNYLQFIVKSLLLHREFSYKITDEIANNFDMLYLAKCYDHIIVIHKFCLNREQRSEIYQFVSTRCVCNFGKSCSVLDQYGSRKREIGPHLNEDTSVQLKSTNTDILASTLESLHCYLVHGDRELFRLRGNKNNTLRFSTAVNNQNTIRAKSKLSIELMIRILDKNGMKDIDVSNLCNWYKINEYDSDALHEDIKDGDACSNLCGYLEQIGNADTYFNVIYVSFIHSFNMDLLELFLTHNDIEKHKLAMFTRWLVENEYDSDAVCQDFANGGNQSNISVYLSVADASNQFYFEFIFDQYFEETFAKESDKQSVGAMNFGVSVLQWLKYGEKPHFNNLKQELLHNKHSTIHEKLYAKYEAKCKIIILSHSTQNYILKELLSVKFYTDTTQFQSALRRAFWKESNNKDGNNYKKRGFYWWATWLYRTALYHSAPLPRFSNENNYPCSIFHGLNDIFVVDQIIPKYNGPISTTLEKTVAQIFSENKGLLFIIQASYTNPFKFVLGIKVDWISCHKNEAEILLINQYLPIVSTYNFERDMNIQVRHLMEQ